ncbi:MAG TPA: sigma-54 dependent transcriptional regulator [Vicinamibacterales bacterium]|nr:sigma-54 dependent transcriptional regulator [Vicinamibacterales bacterium]
MPATILVVDDEPLIRWTLSERLSQDGHVVVEAGTARAALARFGPDVDLVLLDYKLPDSDGLQVLRAMKAADADVPVILLTAFSSIETAVEAMKQGAYHYANKPFNLDELALVVQKALETTRLRREVKSLRASRSEPYAINRIVGESAPMVGLKALLQKVAASPASTVLLRGESGTGKDLAAKTIHYGSERAPKPFMNITCSALPDALLESELFGHERGAFTDARQQKIGLLESAEGGTVFLDEIGEMVPALQAKLLRFLEEKAFKRVGGSGDVRVDVRIIAATNRDLEDAVRKGSFREDLYYRLNVMQITMPSLRDHAADVPLLVTHYIDLFNREFRKTIRGATPETLALLKTYRWPGNIRELRNAIERAMLLAEGEWITPDLLPVTPARAATVQTMELPEDGINLETLERELLVQALRRTAGNQTRAAALLGLNRDQIRYRIEKFGLDKPAVT